MFILDSIIAAALTEIGKAFTGQLLSEEQIRRIGSNAVGAYFRDFLPTPKSEAEMHEQVDQARHYITEASQILTGLQNRLDGQAEQLNQILVDIEEKKKEAEHYQTLASTNQEAFSAFKKELEQTVREQLRAESERGKTTRQIVNIAIWLITLVLGAALGAYFIPLVQALGSAIGFS